jgi:hypothetical protein
MAKAAPIVLLSHSLPTAKAQEHLAEKSLHKLSGITLAPATARLPDLVRIASTRWTIEACFEEACPARCLVAGHCWDPVGLAMIEYAHRFERLPGAVAGRE